MTATDFPSLNASDGHVFSASPGYPKEAHLNGSATTAKPAPLANLPPVLDACCGSRIFWFDRADARAVFVDKRSETHELPDVSSAGGSRQLVISPDIVADFTALPFAAETFALVVFDPPHFARNGRNGWMAKKYGTLDGNWREEIRCGFAECFRVLRTDGTLIFKWNEDEVSVADILALTPEKPLFGNRYGKHYKSHWIVFLKQWSGSSAPLSDNAVLSDRPL